MPCETCGAEENLWTWKDHVHCRMCICMNTQSVQNIVFDAARYRCTRCGDPCDYSFRQCVNGNCSLRHGFDFSSDTVRVLPQPRLVWISFPLNLDKAIQLDNEDGFILRLPKPLPLGWAAGALESDHVLLTPSGEVQYYDTITGRFRKWGPLSPRWRPKGARPLHDRVAIEAALAENALRSNSILPPSYHDATR